MALVARPLFGGIRLPPAAVWPARVDVSLFEMGIRFALWLSALRWSRSAPRLAQLIIGEPIATRTPTGLALIIGAILWQSRLQRGG